MCILLCTQSIIAQSDETSTAEVKAILDSFAKYRHQNKIDKAIETLDEAANIAEKNEDSKLLVDTYHQYARLFIEEEDIDGAFGYFARTGVYLKDMSYPFAEAFHLYLDAAFRFHEGNNFQALKSLQDARKISNNRNLGNNILLLEAYIYTNITNYDDAIKNLHALIVNADDKERAYLATKANLQLTRISITLNDYEEGIIHSKAALELAQKHGFTKEIKIAYEQLSEIYAAKENYQESLFYTQKLGAIRDSVYNIEKIALESETANTIQLEHLQTEMNKLQAQNEELSESKNRSEITAILTSAFLTIISLLAVSLFRNNQIKLKTNDLLYTKNKELELARDAAVSAMEAKTNFLSTVTHELRTPLYAVTGLTHLLLEENPSDHQKEHLKSLKFSGEYLLNFINDILQINKIDAEKLEPLNIEFKLHKVLTDVVESLQQNAHENKTKLILDYDSKIPSQLMGDPIKLSQIFMNLVGNALKFTKNGKVEVIAKLLTKEDNQVKLYFEVRDNGIGISEDQQHTIFDSFEQGSVQINREYGGTGLGLTIVKSLLGLFGSTIFLESELGHGSSFFFELDLEYENASNETLNFELDASEFQFKGLHILIVEDNKINQVITKKMLTKKEITCDIANNGNEAIDLAKENHYDAILMDIHMPGISGEEATRQIRKFNPDIPIIALTAISLDDSLDSFYEAGCNDVVTKPFKPEIFYQKIGENIFRSRMQGSV
ncbi:response regulator [Flagellimonas sp. GZD32]|uniref:hybrid sensor histidine kinase/response regulator n=1 Tax=Flagellimonas cixiensis TaxID=3228750 RepID=UPI0035C89299